MGEEKFKGREKERDVRMTNIVAAKAVTDCIRTSLGPKGMDKMITSSAGDVIITNDGATILQKMEVMHPAAKMIVEVSRAQDVEAGDGTTSVAVVTGALLNASLNLLDKGIHPAVISDAFLVAQEKAIDILRAVAKPIELTDREGLISAAVTSLNSKVVSSSAPLLAPLSVDAILKVIDAETATHVDLNNIKVVKKMGGTVEDTALVDGLVFPHGACHASGGPTYMKEAKVGLSRYCACSCDINL
jgi:T-complex protein 1 subunit delta